MSTNFCYELILYLIQSKRFNTFQYDRKGIDKSLTGPRVSKAGRSDLYRRSTYGQVIKHVFDRLDTAQTENRYLNGLPRLPDQPQCNGFNGGAGKSPRWVTQAGLPGAEVDGHCRVGVCHREGIGSGLFSGAGNKSNVCNKWGEFDPEGTLDGSFACRPNDLGDL